MKKIITLPLLLLAFPCFAEEPTPSPSPSPTGQYEDKIIHNDSEPERKFQLAIFGGNTFSNSDTQELFYNGTSILKVKTKTKNHFSGGIELDYFLPNYQAVSLGGILDGNDTGNEDEAVEYSALGTIKGHLKIGNIDAWGGLGVGITMVKFKKYSETSGDLFMSLSSNIYAGTLVSPRIGMDYPVYDKIFIGVHAALHTYYIKPDIDVTNTKTGQKFTFQDEINRLWFSYGIRLGIGF